MAGWTQPHEQSLSQIAHSLAQCSIEARTATKRLRSPIASRYTAEKTLYGLTPRPGLYSKLGEGTA